MRNFFGEKKPFGLAAQDMVDIAEDAERSLWGLKAKFGFGGSQPEVSAGMVETILEYAEKRVRKRNEGES